jgi:hypothetical protein
MRPPVQRPAAPATLAAGLIAGLIAGCRPGPTADHRSAPSHADSVSAPEAASSAAHSAYHPASVFDDAYTGLGEPARLVVRDSAAWRALWPGLGGGRTDTAGRRPPVPPVDFGREMLLVATLGLQPALGPGIAIDSVVDAGDSLVVVVRTTSLEFRCLAASAFNAPAHVVRVPRDPRPVTFAERHVVLPNCGMLVRP